MLRHCSPGPLVSTLCISILTKERKKVCTEHMYMHVVCINIYYLHYLLSVGKRNIISVYRKEYMYRALYMEYYEYKSVYIHATPLCEAKHNLCTSFTVYLTELIPSLPGLRIMTLHVTPYYLMEDKIEVECLVP